MERAARGARQPHVQPRRADTMALSTRVQFYTVGGISAQLHRQWTVAVDAVPGTNGPGHALRWTRGNLYAGGSFPYAVDPANRIPNGTGSSTLEALWDSGNSGDGIAGTNRVVYALAVGAQRQPLLEACSALQAGYRQ